MASHLETLFEIVQSIRILTAALAGDILFAWGLFGSKHSAQVAAQKYLNALADLLRISKCGKRGGYYYRAVGCTSEWSEHAQQLSQELVRILSKYPQSIALRETSLPLGRRADALVLIRDKDRAACLWLETTLTESATSIANKRRDIENWPEVLEFLSQRFGVEIPSFTFVTSDTINTILED